jgi:hypothetical protein
MWEQYSLILVTTQIRRQKVNGTLRKAGRSTIKRFDTAHKSHMSAFGYISPGLTPLTTLTGCSRLPTEKVTLQSLGF